MKLSKRSAILITLCVLLGGLTFSIKAEYYLDTLFPIGLTGINPTGWASNNCPYGNLTEDPWTWDQGTERREDSLIFALGVNCIGCQDCKPDYVIDLNPDSDENSENNYLHKVCIPSHNDPNIDDIYVITLGWFAKYPTVWIAGHRCPTGDTIIDSVPCSELAYVDTLMDASWGNRSAYFLFHTAYRPDLAGQGSMQFDPHTWHDCDDCYGKNWGCHGCEYDNWNTFGGDSVWCALCDTVVGNFRAYFDNSNSLRTDAKYIWGYNLISEDPAMYRHTNTYLYPDKWHGSWAAVDRYFQGRNSTGFNISGTAEHKWFKCTTHAGIRGVEDSMSVFTSGSYSGHRMIIAKGATWPLHMMGYNIFQYLPEIDAIAVFTHGWCKASFNYGDQILFDNFLYGTACKGDNNYRYMDKYGYHYSGQYMQQYGNTYPARTDQKRRWIAWIAIEWEGVTDDGNATVRRPCPPELRAVTYLVLSRGAKGILYHCWALGETSGLDYFPDNVPIPADPPDTENDPDDTLNRWIGIRDYEGWPYGYSTSPNISHHKLNNGSGGTTYWHSSNRDSTYYYMAHSLIPELKKITPKLMELDWVNGYSLNSTDPQWRSPCPHDYVMEVAGVSYMDLGLFDHPYEPIGVEYFMLVNREGIADMTNRTVTVALDANHWPEEDTLILTDIANSDRPRRLSREGSRFTFTEVFEPGEGKLYRVAQMNGVPVAVNHKQP